MALVRADPEWICVGLPESAYPPVPKGLVAGRALIRNPAGQTIHSRPQVQAFADAVKLSTGVDSFGTYVGHDSPSPDLALDAFVPTTSRVLGDAVAQFAINNMARFGLWYVIYHQRIFNPYVAEYWRDMADRGTPTANHMDHNHLSFLDEPWHEPTPDPEPHEEDDGMKFIAVDNDRGIFLAGENVGEDGKIPARHAGSPEEITALVESGAVKDYDKRPVLPASVFDSYYRVVG